MLKSFSSLAKYLSHSLDTSASTITGTGLGVAHFTMLKSHIQSLVNIASDPKTWDEAKLLEKEMGAEKKKHLRTIFPGIEGAIGDSIKNWHESLEYKKLVKDIKSIYTNVKESGDKYVSPANYNKFMRFVIFYVFALESNRKTVVSVLTNRHSGIPEPYIAKLSPIG